VFNFWKRDINKKEIKLCKDCKNYEPDLTFEDPNKQCNYAKCKMKIEKNKSLVCGGYDYKYCSTARSGFGGFCGPKAKYFEPKDEVKK